MIEINNRVRFAANKNSFSTVAKIILKGENRETKTLSLAFVSKAEIEKLNSKFRKKNKPTDVLSFALSDGEYLGEIVICPQVAKENAKKFKTKAKQEVLKLFVHGVLHLCGYDHEKEAEAEKMEAKEKKYLSLIQ